jgi:hypothetical protein
MPLTPLPSDGRGAPRWETESRSAISREASSIRPGCLGVFGADLRRKKFNLNSLELLGF